MNPLNFKSAASWLSLSVMLMLSLVVSAQEKQVDVDVNLDKGPSWYMQPWVWVVGGAIFILLLVALLRSGRTRD